MDAEAEAKLRDLRLNLAEICLEARLDRIASLSNSPSGDALATMQESGLRHLPMTKADQAVAERCHRMLTLEHDPVRKLCAFIALSLFSFAYRIERSFELIDVPTPLAAITVKTLLSLPQYFERDGDRAKALDHLQRVVEEIHKTARVIDEDEFRKGVLKGFMDGYAVTPVYGEDRALVDMAQQRADLIRLYLEVKGLARDKAPVWPETVPEQVRLGLLSPGAGSETAAIRGHLLGLDRKRFHITAFVPDVAADSVSRGVADMADALIPLPVNDIGGAAELVANEDLDFLIAGTNITNLCRFAWTMLMAQRLARFQVAMHANPLTSGFETVDLFLNGTLNEPDDAEADYTEELVLFEGSSCHYAFPDTAMEAQAVSKSDFGVPEDSDIIVSGANFFKIGPDLVDSWGRILTGAPNAHLVLYPFNPNWSGKYPQRNGFLAMVRAHMKNAGVTPDRLHILEPQPTRAPILGLLSIADLYLDSFPYSGAVSIYEPLIFGCPPIVREGHAARCRQSAALLREMGLDVLVTDSRDDYINTATRLMRDPELRREMSEAVRDVAVRGGLGKKDVMGARVGAALLQVYADRLAANRD